MTLRTNLKHVGRSPVTSPTWAPKPSSSRLNRRIVWALNVHRTSQLRIERMLRRADAVRAPWFVICSSVVPPCHDALVTYSAPARLVSVVRQAG